MSPFEIPQLPADALELFNDPRLAGIADPLPGFSPEERMLTPANPPSVGDSAFLQMRPTYERRGGKVNWINRPSDESCFQQGEGRGLAAFRKERPRLEESVKKPRKVPDIWPYLNWFVASPRFVEIVSPADADAIETAGIDWVFADGKQLDGYVFLDVRRLCSAYDYKRTAVVFTRQHGRTYIRRLAHPRALKPDVDASAQIFRETYYRTDIFVSRMLAREVALAGIKGVYFEDPARIGAIDFDR